MITTKEGGDDKKKGISKENHRSPTQNVKEISRYNRRKIRKMKRQENHPTSKENHQPGMNEENGYWGDKIEEIKIKKV